MRCLDFAHLIVCFRRIFRSSRKGGYQAGSAQVIHLQGVLRFDVVAQLRSILQGNGEGLSKTNEETIIMRSAVRDQRNCIAYGKDAHARMLPEISSADYILACGLNM